MSIISMITDNFAPCVIVLFMCLFLNYNAELERENRRYFSIGLVFLALEIISSSLQSYYSYRDDVLSAWRVFWSAIGYAIRPVLLICMLRLAAQNRKSRVGNILIYVPLVINTVLAFSVYVSKIAYSFSENNKFKAGPLRMYFYYVLGYYVVLITLVLFMQRKDSSALRQIIGYACLALCLAAMFMESSSMDNGAVRTAVSLTFVFYYIYYQSTEHVKEQEEANYIATHDSLTGINNRYAFELITEKFKGSQTPLAFVILDIDHFKMINDSYGHEAGDVVLKKVANLLVQTFRAGDHIFRFGGDEFVILMPGIGAGRADIIQNRMENINIQLAESGVEAIPHATVSAGAAFSESGYSSALYKQADEALYKVKKSARGGIAFAQEK